MFTDFVLLTLFLLLVAFAAAYPLGLAFSLGYHRGKRQFVDRIVRDSCDEKGSSTDG